MSALSWLHTGSALDTPVALLSTGMSTRADLLAQVQAQCVLLRARPETHWSLWQADSYTFLIGLLALIATGKHVVLPPNNTPASQMRLASDAVIAWQLIDVAPLPATTLHLPQEAPISLYTSGSTGEAKHIARNLAQLLHEVDVLEATFGQRLNQSLIIATVSPQHIYGLLFKLLWPLASARPFLNTQLEYPEQVVAALTQFPGATLVSSPALLKRWPDTLPVIGASAVFSSGGALPASARSAFEAQAHLAISEVFGSSETGGIAWRERDGDWQALPSVELAINAEGGLCVRSPHALPGWNCTGDSASLRLPYLSLGVRLDRLVKIEEKRISLDAVEASVRTLTFVRDVHVISLDTATRQELAAVVVLSAEGETQLKTLGRATFTRHLRTALCTTLEALARPRRWRFVAELPMNSQGKLNKAFMHELFQSPSESTPLAAINWISSPQITAVIAQNHLPEVLALQQSDARLTVHARVPITLSYCRGHFPGTPIVPGVAIIAWVEHFARQYLGLSGQFCRMEQIKFQHIIKPLDEFSLQIDYLPEQHRLNFRCYDGERKHASGRLIYREPT